MSTDSEAPEPAEPGPADQEPGEDDKAETRYRNGIAITLAMLAVLGAFIAILQGAASGNESNTAREATRLASESQAARVIEIGADKAKERIDTETALLPLRPGFNLDSEAAADQPVVDDASRRDQAVAAATAELEAILTNDDLETKLFDLTVNARSLSLEQSAVVHERVTWNARASQYETVVTVLGVALFLIGFTAVVGRKLRPPLALPGILLAIYCAGWSAHIYRKEIPDVPPEAIHATALGEAHLADGDPQAAILAFSDGVAADDDYVPAIGGLALSELVLANPDILNTLAITDTTSDTFTRAIDDVMHALDEGGTNDPTTLTTAGIMAIASGDLDAAHRALTRAVELNRLTPRIQFALSALEAARGNEAEARRWWQSAVDLLGPKEESDRNRSIAAMYYTLLEFVGTLEGTDEALVEDLMTRTIVGESGLILGEPVEGEPATGATIEVRKAEFIDGSLTAAAITTGVPEDATVTLVVWERPAEGAAWVQTPELFHAGGPLQGTEVTLATPRNCAPVEYRFDLYTNGVLVDSVTMPGVAATC